MKEAKEFYMTLDSDNYVVLCNLNKERLRYLCGRMVFRRFPGLKKVLGRDKYTRVRITIEALKS